jgi:hypothetical protein
MNEKTLNEQWMNEQWMTNGWIQRMGDCWMKIMDEWMTSENLKTLNLKTLNHKTLQVNGLPRGCPKVWHLQ